MVIKNTFFNNQSGQIVWAVIIGFMVASGSMYMMQNNDLALKDYTRLNQTVKLSILGFTTIEKIKMGLAGNLTNCELPNINAFRNLQIANYETLKWPANENDLASIPTCLISTLDKATISTINLKVFSKGAANIDSLHADIGINLTMQGKNGGKFSRSISINLSVASLANFGLIQTSISNSQPLFYIPNSTSSRLMGNITPRALRNVKVQVFAKTFIRNEGDLALSNLVKGTQITYLSPVYTRSKNILVNNAETLQQNLLAQMKEGFYLNSLSSASDLWTDDTYKSAWKWEDMDHGYIYNGAEGYLLPVQNMNLRVASVATATGTTPSPDWNQSEAIKSQVLNGPSTGSSTGSSTDNILINKNIIETCKSGTTNNLLIYENIDQELIIDFRNSNILINGTDDSRPILCGIISAKNIKIKLSNNISHNILVGLFHVSGQIIIQGSGTLDIINPFQQRTLPNDILAILGDPSFIENQIKNISIYSTTVGRNFTLPIFKTTPISAEGFSPLTPALLQPQLLITTDDCPSSGFNGSRYCWKENITKPVADATFFNNNSEKLMFLVEETL